MRMKIWSSENRNPCCFQLPTDHADHSQTWLCTQERQLFVALLLAASVTHGKLKRNETWIPGTFWQVWARLTTLFQRYFICPSLSSPPLPAYCSTLNLEFPIPWPLRTSQNLIRWGGGKKNKAGETEMKKHIRFVSRQETTLEKFGRKKKDFKRTLSLID